MKTRQLFIALCMGLILTAVPLIIIGRAAPGNPQLFPPRNSHTALPTTTISITYDEPLDASTVNSRTFAVHAMQTGLVTATHGVNGNAIVVTPTRAFHPGELVQTTATTNTLNITGEHPISYTVWQFRTAVQAGGGTFAAHPISPTFGAGNSLGIVLGDIDGDSDLDAIVANQGHEPQDVYLNDGSGTFSAHPIAPTFGGGNSIDVTLGDVDGDGDLDAIVANALSEPNRVYLNDGDGVFTPHPATPALGASYSMYADLGDIDGDGDLDAVVVNFSDQPQDVYLNDGSGAFAAHPVSPTFGAGYSEGIALGDIDGDGDLDAVIANWSQPQDVYLNDGSGVFAAHPISPTFGVGSNGVNLVDIDGDSDLDVIVTNDVNIPFQEHHSVYLNDGNGLFAKSPAFPTFGPRSGAAMALGDLDDDGDLDAVVVGMVMPQDVYLYDGAGQFVSSPLSIYADDCTDVALGDVDGDGDLDVVTAGFSGAPQTVWLNRNRVPGVDPAPNSHDSSQDTDLTIISNDVISHTTVTTQTIFVHGGFQGAIEGGIGPDGDNILYTPAGDFYPGEIVEASITSGTLSNDGTPLVPYVWRFQTTVYSSSGVFVAHPLSPTFGSNSSVNVALGDLDGDGDLDTIIANRSNAAQEIYLNRGDGAFAPHPISPTFGAGVSFGIALGDLDKDGDLDVLIANYGEAQDVYLNDGSGSLTPHPVAPSFGSEDSRDVVLGDVDGDGDLDALIANNNHAQEIYLNDGTGRFTPHPIIPSFGEFWSRSVALGDVDTDGDLDAIITNSYDPQEVFLNDGSGTFTAHPISPTFGANPSHAVALGDIDGDSDLDAVVARISGYPQEVFLNNGTGVFEPHPISSTFGAGYSLDIALGDVDGDGDLDALVTDFGQPDGVFLNDGTGLFFPHPISPTFDADISYAVALGDVDTDGDLDAVIADSSGADTVWLNGIFVAPSLHIIKSVEGADGDTLGLPLSGVVTYTIVLTNSGNDIASGVMMTDELPLGVNFHSWIISGSVHLPPVDNVIEWGPHDIPANTSYTIRFRVSITNDVSFAERIITNTAYFGSTNAGSGSNDAVFTIAPASNNAPWFTSSPVETAIVGIPYTYTIIATDADAGDTLTFNAPVSDTWLTLTQLTTRTANLTGTPLVVGEIPVELQVNDGEDSAAQAFTITVSSANQPPLADAGEDQTVLVNTTVTLDGSGSVDPDGDGLIYGWAQTGGTPVVTLSDRVVVSPTFTAPGTPTALTFTLVVTDALGLSGAPDIVVITVAEYYIYLPFVLK